VLPLHDTGAEDAVAKAEALRLAVERLMVGARAGDKNPTSG